MIFFPAILEMRAQLIMRFCMCYLRCRQEYQVQGGYPSKCSTGNGNPLEIGLQIVLEDEFLVGDGSLFQTAVALILAESRYPAERKGKEAKEAVHFFITVI